MVMRRLLLKLLLLVEEVLLGVGCGREEGEEGVVDVKIG
jgi:hypothetical protein